MIKCVVFDFDGTLVDSNEIKRDAFYEVTNNISGANILLDEILSSSNTGDRYNIFDALIAELKLAGEVFVSASQLSDSYTKICEYKISNAPEIKCTSEVFEKLKKLGIKTFISSATPEITLRRIVNMRGWRSVINKAFGSPDSKIDNLQKILAKNKLSVSEVIYVGDNEIDRMAALSVGCYFVGVGISSFQFDERPQVLISSFCDFLECINIFN